jgi:hypothetical protein
MNGRGFEHGSSFFIASILEGFLNQKLLQVQKRRRLNALNTVVSLLREQLKISSMIGAATSPASQPQPKSAAGDASLVSATSLEGTKVFFDLFVRDFRQF